MNFLHKKNGVMITLIIPSCLKVEGYNPHPCWIDTHDFQRKNNDACQWNLYIMFCFFFTQRCILYIFVTQKGLILGTSSVLKLIIWWSFSTFWCNFCVSCLYGLYQKICLFITSLEVKIIMMWAQLYSVTQKRSKLVLQECIWG